jgi:hypothetical protein
MLLDRIKTDISEGCYVYEAITWIWTFSILLS